VTGAFEHLAHRFAAQQGLTDYIIPWMVVLLGVEA
jgi:hypothetical protein